MKLIKFRPQFRSKFSLNNNPDRRYESTGGVIGSGANDDTVKRNSFSKDMLGTTLAMVGGTQLLNLHNYYHYVDQHVYTHTHTFCDFVQFWGSYGGMISGIALFPVGLFVIRQQHGIKITPFMIMVLIGLICWLGVMIYNNSMSASISTTNLDATDKPNENKN